MLASRFSFSLAGHVTFEKGIYSSCEKVTATSKIKKLVVLTDWLWGLPTAGVRQ